MPDPFQEGRLSGFLPERTGVELIGGPYLHASLKTNFTQFGEGKLCGKTELDKGRLHSLRQTLRAVRHIMLEPSCAAVLQARTRTLFRCWTTTDRASGPSRWVSRATSWRERAGRGRGGRASAA